MNGTHFRLSAAALAAGVILAGCSESRTPTAAVPRLTGPSFTVGDNVTATPTAEVGKIKICKAGNVSGTFSITPQAAGGSPTPSSPTSVTIATGTCTDVAEDFTTTSGSGTFFTIKETSAGLQSVTAQFNNNGTLSSVAFADGGKVFLNDYHGYTVTFTNNVVVAPPEGCSPGYYKKRPQPASGQFIGSTFTNSGYPAGSGPTLQDALNFKGGPSLQDAKNVLLRQAAAAYFNSQRLSGYPLTTAQVVANVNAALASGDRNTILSYSDVLDGDNNLEGPRC
jgi:hypothetical protein